MSVRRKAGPGAGMRACVVTVELMALSALAHAHAGGKLPAPGWFAVMTAVVLVVSLSVLRGSIRVRTAVPVIALLQVGLHLALHTTASHGHAAHAMSADQWGLGLTLPMLTAHLATTAAAAVLLVVQERAIARARDWLEGWRHPRPLLPVARMRTMPTVGGRSPVERWLLLLRSPRRGPPVLNPVAP